MYILIAIFAFGLLIAVHELGHFSAAKLLKVKVYEFAIGMGPKLFQKQGKETLYTLRAFPIGGFCAMEEDVESDDPRAFTSQNRWRRAVILAAGGTANLVFASIIIILVVSRMNGGFVGTTLTDIADGFPNEGIHGLMVGDQIMTINGERLYYIDDFFLLMQLAQSNEIDLTVKRSGAIVPLNNFTLERREYETDGTMQLRYGLSFNRIESSFVEKLKYSAYMTWNNVRIIKYSLAQLFSGEAGVRDLAGPVAIVDAMNEIGKTSRSIAAALLDIAEFTAFIGVNIAVINLLPIPAMDGGRILFLSISWLIEKALKRRLDPKYEGYIHTSALLLLMGLMVFILFNDIMRIASR